MIKNYFINKEINRTYDDFLVFGYYGLSKRQHAFMREECKKLGLYK